MVKKIHTFIKTKRAKIFFWICFSLSLLTVVFFIVRETQVLPQSAINILVDVLLPNKGDNVLVIVPHQDDETLGAGGFIQRALENKANVFLILVTDGNHRKLEAKRIEEFKNVTKFFGIPKSNIAYLDFPDDKLSQMDVSIIKKDLISKMLDVDPKFILYPTSQDSHPDHHVIGTIIEDSLDIFPGVKAYGYLVHHSGFPQPEGLHKNAYILPPLSMLSLDTSWEALRMTKNEQARKCEAILMYKTQIKNPLPVLKNLMLAFCRQNEIFLTAKY